MRIDRVNLYYSSAGLFENVLNFAANRVGGLLLASTDAGDNNRRG